MIFTVVYNTIGTFYSIFYYYYLIDDGFSFAFQLEGSLEDFVLELGYSFTSSYDECSKNIVRFGKASFTPTAVAKVIGLMLRTVSGLQTEQVS